MDNIYITKELIGAQSIDELDFEFSESFGFDYETHEDFIEIQKGDFKKCDTWEATPISIIRVLNLLEEMRDKGANYVEIEDNPDHHGYDFSFLKVNSATENDIEKYINKEKKKKNKMKQAEIEQLKAKLKNLEK